MKGGVVALYLLVTVAGTAVIVNQGPELIKKARKKFRDIIRQEIKNLMKDELKSFRDELKKAFG
jgi:phosphoserine phosphatase